MAQSEVCNCYPSVSKLATPISGDMNRLYRNSRLSAAQTAGTTSPPNFRLIFLRTFNPQAEHRLLSLLGTHPGTESTLPGPSSANTNPSSPLDNISVELLLGIADVLTSESLIVFSRAYPRFASIVAHHKLYLYRELTCFFLQTPITDHKTVLGVGVNYDSRKKFITSSFD
jgi:hypothetical protein